jgi:hypothetical protein
MKLIATPIQIDGFEWFSPKKDFFFGIFGW